MSTAQHHDAVPAVGTADDPQLQDSLRALQVRLSPRWWFHLPEAVVLGAIIGLMAVNPGIAAVLAGLFCIAVLVLASRFYPGRQGAAIDRTFRNTAMGDWQALAFLGLGAVSAFASYLADRVAASWPAIAGLALLVALAAWATIQLTTRSTARRIAGPAGRRSLAESRAPQTDPLLAHDDGALRMAVLLSFVEKIRPEALREDLRMPPEEFTRTLGQLRDHGFLQRESSSEEGDWLRPTLGGHRALRDHLAAAVPAAEASAR